MAPTSEETEPSGSAKFTMVNAPEVLSASQGSDADARSIGGVRPGTPVFHVATPRLTPREVVDNGGPRPASVAETGLGLQCGFAGINAAVTEGTLSPNPNGGIEDLMRLNAAEVVSSSGNQEATSPGAQVAFGLESSRLPSVPLSPTMPEGVVDPVVQEEFCLA